MHLLISIVILLILIFSIKITTGYYKEQNKYKYNPKRTIKLRKKYIMSILTRLKKNIKK